MATEPSPLLPGCCPLLPPVFSVLVCDHQPADSLFGPRLYERIQKVLSEAFAYAREALIRFPSRYEESVPRLRVVMACTLGTDTLAIQAVASHLNAELVIIALDEADPIVNACRVCFDIPAGADAAALEIAAEARDLLALAQTDLVVAAWDGRARDLHGGSMRLIHRAVLARKPVVWIQIGEKAGLNLHLLDRMSLLDRRLLPLQAPETLADYLRNCFVGFDPASLRREILLQFAPQEAGGDERHLADLDDLLVARLPGRRWLERSGSLDACLWHVAGLQGRRASREAARFCKGSVGLRFWQRLDKSIRAIRDPYSADGTTRPSGFARSFKQAGRRVRDAWSSVKEAEAPLADQASDPLFAWMDAMATFTAGRHRGAIWVLNICAAFTVLFAVWGSIAERVGGATEGTLFAELVLLLGILVLLWVALRRRWHRRWLFCRAVAEQLRMQDVLAALLSFSPAATRSPWRCGKDGLALVDASAWLVQRWLIGRHLGTGDTEPRVVRLDDLDVQRLRQEIDGQIAWMRGKRQDLEQQHRNMERLSFLFFLVALVSVCFHFWRHDAHWLLFFTAVSPAAGAAVASILNHAEVHRVAQGYGRVAHRLRDITEAAIDEAERATHSSSDAPTRWWHRMQVRRLGMEAARVMAEENQTWHDLLSSRAPTLPG